MGKIKGKITLNSVCANEAGQDDQRKNKRIITYTVAVIYEYSLLHLELSIYSSQHLSVNSESPQIPLQTNKFLITH